VIRVVKLRITQGGTNWLSATAGKLDAICQNLPHDRGDGPELRALAALLVQLANADNGKAYDIDAGPGPDDGGRG
jgi:hypothetical protein